jgi:hypothetical protein
VSWITPKFTGGQLKHNILYAWSRKPEDIVFTEGAITAVMECSQYLSDRYGRATDIPIVSPSDQRNKVARLSASLALLLHNVTNGKTVVEAEHVKFIKEYLVLLYDSNACGLRLYAINAVGDEVVTKDEYEDIKSKLLTNSRFLIPSESFRDFLQVFLTQGYIRLNELEAMLDLEREDAKTLIKGMVKLRLITHSTSGYRKTAKFNSFLESAMVKGEA